MKKNAEFFKLFFEIIQILLKLICFVGCLLLWCYEVTLSNTIHCTVCFLSSLHEAFYVWESFFYLVYFVSKLFDKENSRLNISA